MRRFSATVIGAVLLVGVFAPASFAAPVAAANAAVPRVVFVVGPVGGSTGAFRAQARAAARIARTYTPDVVELYSPNATWSAVKQALQGASLVIYMGHGNGWPSRYRDSPFPSSQNGFGLNPTAGGGDSSHQYFGEAAVGSQVTLAKNAVVLLNHLCYASGLSEPGLPEGSLDVGRQRVDNYAAGFIRAGAAAVIAEAWASPSYLVRAILGGNKSIQSAWQSSPNANGNRIAFESQRSPGYVAQMDMETSTSGFTRSVVMKAGLAPSDVLAGARGSARIGTSFGPVIPSLARSGLTVAAPTIVGLPSAGSATTVNLPFTIRDRAALPAGLAASVRLEPIALTVAPSAPTAPVAPTDPTTPVAPTDPTAPAGPTDPTTPSGKPPKADDPDVAPAQPAAPPRQKRLINPPTAGVDLIVPERLADVVAPAAVSVGASSLAVPVTLPAAPGRYRLTITLHDTSGVAYDAATQALIPSMVVRVTGEFDGAIQVVPAVQVGAGEEFSLGFRVVNLGKTPWGRAAMGVPFGGAGVAPADPAMVVGRWVPLSAGAAAPSSDAVSTPLPIEMVPGVPEETSLGLIAPSTPGEYLYLLDVVVPERGSLTAAGVEPTTVRITVVPAS